MKKLVVGMLAHVDAGKTTLSEALLYCGGALRKMGRVDHRDAFLDTNQMERERGITIFSKPAQIIMSELELTLVDTPGHVDFSTEMERALAVLDYGILVISGSDGVQSHTRTLWRLLKRYHIPVFLFINKMDLAGVDREALQRELKTKLDEGCIAFDGDQKQRDEEIALCGEQALEEYLAQGCVPEGTVAQLIQQRKIFPCWYGSALKLEGVEGLLTGLKVDTLSPVWPKEFGAKVFKVSRDNQGSRLTWLKVTGGKLKAKTLLNGVREGIPWEEKADQLRQYSGEKFRPLEQVEAGSVCAVTGLTHTYPGQGLGREIDTGQPLLEPVLSYQLLLSEGADPHSVLPNLRILEEEDPMLRVVWDEQWKQIHVRLMGQVQLEVLKRVLQDRFGLKAELGAGSIVYRETIAQPVEGIGHFEPLRHYAEVHLLLEPGPRGSGVQVASACSTDQLDLNWQRLILSHLLEREHPGILTGSPLTDVKITLVAGRAHLKHTEGGDFRQATYRAVRQGLMQVPAVLLEPCYDLFLEVPASCVGRAMADLQTMGGTVDGPQPNGENMVFTGYAPVAGLQNYWQEVVAYTRGQGHLTCSFRGYEPCTNTEAVMEAVGYDPERDVENPTGSVFCSHGGGFYVPWNQVKEHMHIDSGLDLEGKKTLPTPQMVGGRQRRVEGSLEQDRELQAIFERTYGKVEQKGFQAQKKPARTSLDEGKYNIQNQNTGPEYLLVDGYNIIFAWEELQQLAREDVSAARATLEEILVNYQHFRKCVVILVFDAYKVKGNLGSVEKRNNIYVVYTKEAETADAYIEKTTYDLSRNHRVRVATSDGLEQMIILGHGALRLSARSFRTEVEQTQGEIARLIEQQNRRNRELGKLEHTARIISKEKQ